MMKFKEGIYMRKFIKRCIKMVFNKQIITLSTIVMMLLGTVLFTLPVKAVNTPVQGGTFSFNKYLVMDSDANVPNVSFSFSIEPGQVVNNTAIKQGIYAERVTIDTAVFTSEDSGSTENGLPTDGVDAVTPNKKYASKEVRVDFRNVSFSAPGIYRYIITENSETPETGITYASSLTLDVYVGYEEKDGVISDTTLVVMDYILHDGTFPNPDDDELNNGYKGVGFVNQFTSYQLSLSKVVTGNQGDRDKYFIFNVVLEKANPSTKVFLSGSEYEIIETTIGTYDKSTNTLSLDDGDDGSVSFTCKLKHNGSLIIHGLTSSTIYSIEEEDCSSEGYTTTVKVDAADPIISNSTDVNSPEDDNMARTMGDSSHTVVFTNTREGTVPTGILLDVAPYIILGGVVIVGFVVLIGSRRRYNR